MVGRGEEWRERGGMEGEGRCHIEEVRWLGEGRNGGRGEVSH